LAIETRFLLAALLGLVLAAPAAAQTEPTRAVNFGIGGGTSLPILDARGLYKTGFNGQGFMRLDVAGWPFSLRGDFSYQIFQMEPIALAGTGSTSGTGTVLGGLGGLQFTLSRGHMRPYLLASAGVYNIKSEPDAPNAPVTSSSHFGFAGGAGVLFSVGTVLLYTEGRWDHVLTHGEVVPADKLDIVPISVGVIF
jgi:hypothetical protein